MSPEATAIVRELDQLDIGFEPGSDGALSFTRTKGKSTSEGFRERVAAVKPELISIATARRFDTTTALALTLKQLQSVDRCELVVRRENGKLEARTPDQILNSGGNPDDLLSTALRSLDLSLVSIRERTR
jgi:hypothetical protein